jgi:O-antigen/teichoic acid export membrane protein
MHFTNRDRIVLGALVAAVVLNLALCIPLSDRYGALGAAIAYAVPIALLHVGLWFFELADLVRYKLALWHAKAG